MRRGELLQDYGKPSGSATALPRASQKENASRHFCEQWRAANRGRVDANQREHRAHRDVILGFFSVTSVVNVICRVRTYSSTEGPNPDRESAYLAGGCAPT